MFLPIAVYEEGTTRALLKVPLSIVIWKKGLKNLIFLMSLPLAVNKKRDYQYTFWSVPANSAFNQGTVPANSYALFQKLKTKN